jgi:hypothetical protein
MPLDVLGRTRATLIKPMSVSVSFPAEQSAGGAGPAPEGVGNLVKLDRDGDRSLQLSILNEEFLVSAVHHIALITSLPFVHTARRYYRLNELVRSRDCGCGWRKPTADCGNLNKLVHLEEVKVVTRFP